MSNVFKLQPARFPGEADKCLQKLAAHAKAGKIHGVAFVCLLDDDKFIADTCGSATRQPDKIRQLLRALDARVAKRQLASRK